MYSTFRPPGSPNKRSALDITLVPLILPVYEGMARGLVSLQEIVNYRWFTRLHSLIINQAFVSPEINRKCSRSHQFSAGSRMHICPLYGLMLSVLRRPSSCHS